METKVISIRLQGENLERFTKKLVDSIEATQAVWRTQTGKHVKTGVNIREPLLLGQMCDCAIRTKPGIAGGFYCVYCRGEGKIPPDVRHNHNCLVMQARALLNEQMAFTPTSVNDTNT